MAWKYRKRIKIAPGITINLSKSGVSTTIGTKGASINIGNKGTYLNTGIPGAGIYDRQRIGGGANTHSSYMSTHKNSGNGNTSGYDNSGCYWYIGIALVVLFAIYTIVGHMDLSLYLLGLFITFVLWIIVIAILPSKKQTKANAVDNYYCPLTFSGQ